jgi:hypothetical protein
MPDRKRGKITRESHLPEVDTILRDLESQKRQVLVILFIPSHDKNEQELPAQDQWADAALELFADLFGGATALKLTGASIGTKSEGKILKTNRSSSRVSHNLRRHEIPSACINSWSS